MALPSFAQLGYLHRGFLSVLLFYLIGLGGSVILAQFVPIAGMFTVGLPVLTGLVTLGIGAYGAVATILAFLFGYRTATLKGMLAAHALLLLLVITTITILSVTDTA